MALAGTLKDFGLPDIFQLIGLQRKTGVLHMEHRGETAKLIFENGNVVDAESSLVRTSDRIGVVLVNQGAITQEQLNEGLALQRQTLQRLGQVLLSENMVAVESLRKARESQLLHVVFGLFRWKEGSYNFEAQSTVDYDRGASVALGADFILMEGIRMVDEWPIIERKIPSMGSVCKRLIEPTQIQVKTSEDGLSEVITSFDGTPAVAKPGMVQLSPTENMVFQAVDGKRSCQDIVDMTPLHDFAVCRALLDLMERNIVALTDAKGRTATTVQTSSGSTVRFALLGVALLAAGFGVYRNWRSPFGVFGAPPLIQPMLNGLKSTDVERTLVDLDARVRAFRIAEGRLPQNLDELAQAGFATRSETAGVTLNATATGFSLSANSASGPLRFDRSLVNTVPPPDATVSPSPSPSPAAGR